MSISFGPLLAGNWRAILAAPARPTAIRGQDLDRFAITALFPSLVLAAGFPGAARAGEIQLEGLRPKR
jgi:hypothetical protein